MTIFCEHSDSAQQETSLAFLSFFTGAFVSCRQKILDFFTNSGF